MLASLASWVFSGGSDGKESACNAGVLGSASGSGRSPGGGHDNPLQYSCLEFHGRRGLAGYSPQGCKESDRTERLSFSLWLPRYSSTATQENNLNDYLTDTTSERRSDFGLIKSLTEKKKRFSRSFIQQAPALCQALC